MKDYPNLPCLTMNCEGPAYPVVLFVVRTPHKAGRPKHVNPHKDWEKIVSICVRCEKIRMFPYPEVKA